jgi:hypothetical protein
MVANAGVAKWSPLVDSEYGGAGLRTLTDVESSSDNGRMGHGHERQRPRHVPLL